MFNKKIEKKNIKWYPDQFVTGPIHEVIKKNIVLVVKEKKKPCIPLFQLFNHSTLIFVQNYCSFGFKWRLVCMLIRKKITRDLQSKIIIMLYTNYPIAHIQNSYVFKSNIGLQIRLYFASDYPAFNSSQAQIRSSYRTPVF